MQLRRSVAKNVPRRGPMRSRSSLVARRIHAASGTSCVTHTDLSIIPHTRAHTHREAEFRRAHTRKDGPAHRRRARSWGRALSSCAVSGRGRRPRDSTEPARTSPSKAIPFRERERETGHCWGRPGPTFRLVGSHLAEEPLEVELGVAAAQLEVEGGGVRVVRVRAVTVDAARPCHQTPRPEPPAPTDSLSLSRS